MQLTPVENLLSRQGGERDVASHFQVSDLIKAPLTSHQLRSITASSWLCQKVVGTIPKEMVSVEFGLTLTGETGKARAIRDLTIIQEQLKRMMPWFGEAQRRANIVGKAYLIIKVDSVIPILAEIDEIEPEEEILAPPEKKDPVANAIQGIQFHDEGMRSSTSIQGERIYQTGNETSETTSLGNLVERFPYSFPIQWETLKNVQVSGLEIVDGDRYVYTKNGKFLYRKSNALSSSNTAKDVDLKKTLEKWYRADPDGDTRVLEIIHESHLIEFTAFDYQEEYINKKDVSDKVDLSLERGGQNNKISQSFRLTRFISSLLYYDSFTNAVLNRTHRSEFLVYRKPNLGDTNLEIARAVANQQQSFHGAPPVVMDPQLAIEQELKTVANSAINSGVVMIDKEAEMEMLARSFTGIQNVHDVFRPMVIGSSGLTEFTLFGVVLTSAGLNGQDVRDRMAISGQVDILFRDSWQPMLERLGNYIALSYKNFPSNAYIALKPSSSFRLTELEISDVLDKLIKTRLELVKWGVISREELRTELKGDGLIGKYFSLTQPDATTIAEIATNDDLLEDCMFMQSLMSSTSSTTTDQEAEAETETEQQVTSTKNSDSAEKKIRPNIRGKNLLR